MTLPATDRRTGGQVPIPLGRWLRCGACWSTDTTIRAWAFHTRPGTPTVPHRADVHVKCMACAHGWWHGVALDVGQWTKRPRILGMRRWLTALSAYDPWIFNRSGVS